MAEPKNKELEAISTKVMFVAFDEIEARGSNSINIPDDVRRELRVKAIEFASLLLQHLPKIIGQAEKVKSNAKHPMDGLLFFDD